MAVSCGGCYAGDIKWWLGEFQNFHCESSRIWRSNDFLLVLVLVFEDRKFVEDEKENEDDCFA
jgi:hypothetical protein